MNISYLEPISAQRGKSTSFLSCALLVLCFIPWLRAQSAPAPHEIVLQLDPAHTTAEMTLTGNFHTVQGSFQSVRGTIHYDPVTGKTSGEIVFDATSGQTGNQARDNKMHKFVLESARFRGIVFRPDHAEGTLASSGDSTLQVQGIFAIHGSEHEVTIPVAMHLEGAAWTAKSNFKIPYADWGMKNPSVLFLKVSDSVDIQFHAAGSLLP